MLTIVIGYKRATALWEDIAQILDGGAAYKIWLSDNRPIDRLAAGMHTKVGPAFDGPRMLCYRERGAEDVVFQFKLCDMRLAVEDDVYYWAYTEGAYAYAAAPAWKPLPPTIPNHVRDWLALGGAE